MKYKRIFTTHYLHLTIYTNSKNLCKLIGNFLDFKYDRGSLEHKIRVRLYLDESDEKRFISQNLVKKNIVLSSLDNKIASIRTNMRRGIVKVVLNKYQESEKERVLDFILIKPLCLILGHHGLFSVHASMLSKDNDCMLISGPNDAGKSTLALILAQNGYQLLSDDDCFVKMVKNQIQAFPFPTKMGLSENILKRYPRLAKYALEHPYGGKRRVSLNAVSAQNSTRGYNCKAIIFPRYIADKKIHINETPRAMAIKKLTKECRSIYPERESQKMVWTFYCLAKQARSFELIYNDSGLNEVFSLIEKSINK